MQNTSFIFGKTIRDDLWKFDIVLFRQSGELPFNLTKNNNSNSFFTLNSQPLIVVMV